MLHNCLDHWSHPVSLNCWIAEADSDMVFRPVRAPVTPSMGFSPLGEHVSETSELLSSWSAGCSEEDEP